MALDPKHFEAFEPLPNKGSIVNFARKGERVRMGIVRLVFLAMDTPAIKIEPLGLADMVTLFPEFGDTWELVA